MKYNDDFFDIFDKGQLWSFYIAYHEVRCSHFQKSITVEARAGIDNHTQQLYVNLCVTDLLVV